MVYQGLFIHRLALLRCGGQSQLWRLAMHAQGGRGEATANHMYCCECALLPVKGVAYLTYLTNTPYPNARPLPSTVHAILPVVRLVQGAIHRVPTCYRTGQSLITGTHIIYHLPSTARPPKAVATPAAPAVARVHR